MIIVTGAAGFIGSHLVHALNERHEHNILAVDDLQQGDKFHHLADALIADATRSTAGEADSSVAANPRFRDVA